MVFEPTIPQLDFTTRDFRAVIVDSIDLVRFFTPEWTDLNPSDQGVVIYELFAAQADGLHFQIDRALNESFIQTAIKRESVINLLKLIDFDLPGKSAASLNLTFSIDAALGSDLIIPGGTQVQTEEDSDTDVVFFETDTIATILTGETEVIDVPATEGKSESESLPSSTGQPFQKILLTPIDIIEGSLIILVDEGSGFIQWTEISNIVLAGSEEEVYETSRLANGQVQIKFGDSANGRIPAASSQIEALFKRGGGIRGNIGADTVKQVNTQILLSGLPISVDVTNPEEAQGGGEEMPIEEAKIFGPLTTRANDRAVSEEDYFILARSVSGIAKAFARNKGPGQVGLVIAPSGGGLPTQDLKDDVLAHFLDGRKMFTFVLEIEEPTFIFFTLQANVTVRSNFIQSEVKTRVNNAILAFYDFDTSDEINFGNNINFSDIVAIIDNLDGVDFVDFTVLTIFPIAVLETWSGDTTFSEIVITATTLRETWTIQFFSTTDFTATGSVSGLQAATGTVDALYTSDGGEVAFTVISGTTPNAIGDKATFRTSVLLGNIEIGEEELPELSFDIDDDFTFVGGV